MNKRQGREAKQRRKETALDNEEKWANLSDTQKLKKVVDGGYRHTDYAKKLMQKIAAARQAKGDV